MEEERIHFCVQRADICILTILDTFPLLGCYVHIMDIKERKMLPSFKSNSFSQFITQGINIEILTCANKSSFKIFLNRFDQLVSILPLVYVMTVEVVGCFPNKCE